MWGSVLYWPFHATVFEYNIVICCSYRHDWLPLQFWHVIACPSSTLSCRNDETSTLVRACFVVCSKAPFIDLVNAVHEILKCESYHLWSVEWFLSRLLILSAPRQRTMPEIVPSAFRIWLRLIFNEFLGDCFALSVLLRWLVRRGISPRRFIAFELLHGFTHYRSKN